GAVLGHAPQALLIERGVGLMLLQLEVTAGKQPAFLDQQHLEAGGAEYLGAGGAPGAAADDGNIDLQRQFLLELGGVDGFPAALASFGKDIPNRHVDFLKYAVGLGNRIGPKMPACCSRTAG